MRHFSFPSLITHTQIRARRGHAQGSTRFIAFPLEKGITVILKYFNALIFLGNIEL